MEGLRILSQQPSTLKASMPISSGWISSRMIFYHFGLRLELVAIVDFPDDASVGVEAGDDRAAMRHVIIAAAECAGQRHRKRDAFDSIDLQFGDHRTARLAPELKRFNDNHAAA